MRNSLPLILLSLALAPLSCIDGVQTRPYGDPPVSTEHLDTVRQSPYAVVAKPTLFEKAFFTGTFAGEKSRYQMTTIGIGRINSESGKIIPCSPIGMDQMKPVYVQFPVGQFPVQLAIAKQNGDERVAFSRILFSAAPVATWEMARTAEQEPLPVFDTLSYSYPVDGGEGLFIDSVANRAFDSLTTKNSEFWFSAMDAGSDKHYRNTWDFNVFEFGGHNIVVFSTGWGDGSYTSYIGRDSSGRPTQLLTDFDMFDWMDGK